MEDNLQNQTTEVTEEVTPVATGAEESANAEQSETVNVTEERDRERDAIFADARRRAEAEYKKKEAELNARVVRNFGNVEGVKDINSLLDKYEAEQLASQKDALKANGVDLSVIDNYINNMPVVREAQAYVEQKRLNDAQEALNADLAEIQKLDPSLKSLEDLPSSVKERVIKANGSISLLESYKIENFGVVSSKKAEALQQKAINDMRGKGHLNPVNGSVDNSGLVEVPDEELRALKRFYPDASYEELRKKYNNVLNN